MASCKCFAASNKLHLASHQTNDRNCLVFKAPPLDEVTKNTYAYGNKCYTFKERLTKCTDNKDKIEFQIEYIDK